MMENNFVKKLNLIKIIKIVESIFKKESDMIEYFY